MNCLPTSMVNNSKASVHNRRLLTWATDKASLWPTSIKMGFPDLVVANIGPNMVYTNNGDGTFTNNPIPLVNHTGGWTTSIACGDLGGDHLPEIVAVNYINDPQALTTACTPESTHCSPRVFQPAVDNIWQIEPNGGPELIRRLLGHCQPTQFRICCSADRF